MVLPEGGAAAGWRRFRRMHDAGWRRFRRMHDAGRQLVAAARRRDLYCVYYL